MCVFENVCMCVCVCIYIYIYMRFLACVYAISELHMLLLHIHARTHTQICISIYTHMHKLYSWAITAATIRGLGDRGAASSSPRSLSGSAPEVFAGDDRTRKTSMSN